MSEELVQLSDQRKLFHAGDRAVILQHKRKTKGRAKQGKRGSHVRFVGAPGCNARTQVSPFCFAVCFSSAQDTGNIRTGRRQLSLQSGGHCCVGLWRHDRATDETTHDILKPATKQPRHEASALRYCYPVRCFVSVSRGSISTLLPGLAASARVGACGVRRHPWQPCLRCDHLRETTLYDGAATRHQHRPR